MSAPKLRYSPYAIFQDSQSPPGLYARQKWLNQGETETYRADFAATVAKLKSAFMNPGSRSERILDHLHRLFGLHLTVRNADRFIETALDDVIGENKVRSQQTEIVLIPDSLKGLPFAATHWEFFIGPASLFLAAIFGQATDPGVDSIYAQLAANVAESAAFRRNAAAMHNALRALVVHPDDRFRAATRSAVSWFASQQTAHGDWGPNIPFFQAFNAMAHLSISEANAQFDNALKHVVEGQNRDGTWGRADQEWQTFLVVHALRKKGII
jgi:hypothetical protein